MMYSTLCVPRVSLCSHSTVYLPRAQLMSLEYSLSFYRAVYVTTVSFMSLKYSLRHKSTV